MSSVRTPLRIRGSKGRKPRVYLQVDFNGPLVPAKLIAEARRDKALAIARQTGLLRLICDNAAKKNPALAEAIASVTQAEFGQHYEAVKKLLKKNSNCPNPHDDVIRVAAILLETARKKSLKPIPDGLTYNDLLKGVPERTKKTFFKKLAGPVKRATAQSFDGIAFSTLSNIMQRAKERRVNLKVDVVSDNSALLFKRAFLPALRAQIKSGPRGLSRVRYRRNPKTSIGKWVRRMTLLFGLSGKSRAYVSEATWGRKTEPKMWGKILRDRKVKGKEVVILVDDTFNNLKSFHKQVKVYGAIPIAVHLDLKKKRNIALDSDRCYTTDGIQHLTIHSMDQLEGIMGKLF